MLKGDVLQLFGFKTKELDPGFYDRITCLGECGLFSNHNSRTRYFFGCLLCIPAIGEEDKSGSALSGQYEQDSGAAGEPAEIADIGQMSN